MEKIESHYTNFWKQKGASKYWHKGPISKLGLDFCILEFEPTSTRNSWTYATSGMSFSPERGRIELHIFSWKQDQSLVELLNMVAYFHLNEASLGLNHSVNFGKSWQDNSQCTFGLISLPYLDGPELENGSIYGSSPDVKFLWLIPITAEEREYKKNFGIDKLEERFEEAEFNYIDPNRDSVISSKK